MLSTEPSARVPPLFPALVGAHHRDGDTARPGDVMGQGEGRKLQLLEATPLCKAGDMLLSRDAEGPKYSQGCEAPSPSLYWHHLLPLPMVQEQGDQKELPAGPEGAGVWCVLIQGLRSSEGPGKLQGGEGKAVL